VATLRRIAAGVEDMMKEIQAMDVGTELRWAIGAYMQLFPKSFADSVFLYGRSQPVGYLHVVWAGGNRERYVYLVIPCLRFPADSSTPRNLCW
jgi:hypothetical protein